jgi:hypothetical protein
MLPLRSFLQLYTSSLSNPKHGFEMEQVFKKIFVMRVFLLQLSAPGNCATYYYTYKRLTIVPDDIPSDATTINLYNNRISKIHKANFNGTFPQLADLYLQDNMISSVDKGCFEGTALSKINLGNNQLTTFPDFSAVKNTLKTITTTRLPTCAQKTPRTSHSSRPLLYIKKR